MAGEQRTDEGPRLDRAAEARSALLTDLTVVIVRDHLHPEGSEPHRELTLCLEGVLAQPLVKDTRVIVAVGPQGRDTILPVLQKLSARGARLELVPGDLSKSQDMKNLAYSKVQTGWTLYLDSDCSPQPGCLDALAAALALHPTAQVVSCLTTYGDDTAWRRVAAVVDRGDEDISVSAALFRTELLTKYPMTDGPPHTKANKRRRGIMDSGAPIHFEPTAIVHHEYEGIAFCEEFWRTRGFALMWQSGAPSYRRIPRKLARAFREALRRIRLYGPSRFKTLDWLLIPPVLIVSMYFAALGMSDCVRGKDRAAGTSFV